MSCFHGPGLLSQAACCMSIVGDKSDNCINNVPWWVACTQTCRLNKLREQQADGAPDPWLQPAVRLQDQQPVITDDRLEFRIDFWALQLTTCHQRSVADDALPATCRRRCVACSFPFIFKQKINFSPLRWACCSTVCWPTVWAFWFDWETTLNCLPSLECDWLQIGTQLHYIIIKNPK